MISEYFIGFVLLLVGVTLLIFLTKRNKAIKENAKQTMYVVAIWSILFLVINFFLVFFEFIDVNSFWVLIGHQVLSLGLGIGFVFSVYKFLPWVQKELHFYEILLSLIVPLIVAGLQIAVFRRFSFIENSFIINFIPSLIFFIVPVLAIKSFVFLMNIPEPTIKYKTWLYPVNEDIDEPSHEMPDVIPINIAVSKGVEDDKITVVRANAPIKMKFGDFFYFVLQDYNLKNAKEPIYFSDQYDKPYKWHFSIDPRWYETRRFLDPALTLEENKIGDNRKIDCSRLLSD